MDIAAKLKESVTAGDVPGVIAAAATDKGVIFEGAVGNLVQDSVIWIASMTKAVTGAAAMQMVERGKFSLDQARDHCDVAKRAPQHRRLVHPRLEVVPQHVLIEQLLELLLGRRSQAPQAKHIVGGHETQRLQSHAFHAASQQHAQGLMGVPALEAVGDDELLGAARESFDHQGVGAGQP